MSIELKLKSFTTAEPVTIFGMNSKSFAEGMSDMHIFYDSKERCVVCVSDRKPGSQERVYAFQKLSFDPVGVPEAGKSQGAK